MSTLKCKMCGGTLQYEEGKTVVKCEYCGSINTLPNVGNEKRLQLFERANRLRANCDFEKSSGIYEAIVAEYPEESEAYWGLVLCKYGVEYVDDPATRKKVPTCHRSSFESVFDDDNFEQVMETCDSSSRDVYRDEAKQIEEIRRGIVEISSKEDPYDIFICYKETDDNGDRTIDSLIAQDIYDALVAKRFKVFFSRITLEDKLGQEYEPYIFAALNSAQVMLVVGTSYGNLNAVWVKNEWARYLKLMETNKGKYLIPCYRDIDAYDMPKEFSKLQAQDMGKVAAIQDLVRGIEKLIQHKETKTVVQSGVDTASLLKRMNLLLSEKDWSNANILAESILASEPDNADVYIGKLMADMQVSEVKELEYCSKPLESSRNYKKAIECSEESVKQQLEQYNVATVQRFKAAKRKKAVIGTVITIVLITVVAVCGFFAYTKWIPEKKYNEAMQLFDFGRYSEASQEFFELGEYKDSEYYAWLTSSFGSESGMREYESLQNLKTGDEVSFGGLEWIVLEVEGTRSHLISKDVVAKKMRFDKTSNVWEESSLRRWLNESFLYDSSFISLSDGEMSMIETVNDDMVSILTLDEAEAFSDVFINISNFRNFPWWLRTVGSYEGGPFVSTIRVSSNIVSIDAQGSRCDSTKAVHPTIWINTRPTDN